jgi:6-phospho-3-hexuloisomerase
VIAEKILQTLEATLLQIDDGVFNRFLEAFRPECRVFVVGAGRSGYVGKCFAMRLMHLGFETYVVGETNTPSISKEDLLLGISSSGTTASVVDAVEKALKHGAKTLALTSNAMSPLAGKSSLTAHIPQPDPAEEEASSSLPLGSRFELSALLYLEATVAELMKRHGITEEEMKNRHTNL